jgi:hypothetical protein
MIRIFSVIGALMLAGLAWSSYTGWNFGTYQTVRNVPPSVRTNPGIYRSVFTRVPHK